MTYNTSSINTYLSNSHGFKLKEITNLSTLFKIFFSDFL